MKDSLKIAEICSKFVDDIDAIIRPNGLSKVTIDAPSSIAIVACLTGVQVNISQISRDISRNMFEVMTDMAKDITHG